MDVTAPKLRFCMDSARIHDLFSSFFAATYVLVTLTSCQCRAKVPSDSPEQGHFRLENAGWLRFLDSPAKHFNGWQGPLQFWFLQCVEHHCWVNSGLNAVQNYHFFTIAFPIVTDLIW
jgi:hypothetical protein